VNLVPHLFRALTHAFFSSLYTLFMNCLFGSFAKRTASISLLQSKPANAAAQPRTRERSLLQKRPAEIGALSVQKRAFMTVARQMHYFYTYENKIHLAELVSLEISEWHFNCSSKFGVM